MVEAKVFLSEAGEVEKEIRVEAMTPEQFLCSGAALNSGDTGIFGTPLPYIAEINYVADDDSWLFRLVCGCVLKAKAERIGTVMGLKITDTKNSLDHAHQLSTILNATAVRLGVDLDWTEFERVGKEIGYFDVDMPDLIRPLDLGDAEEDIDGVVSEAAGV